MAAIERGIGEVWRSWSKASLKRGGGGSAGGFIILFEVGAEEEEAGRDRIGMGRLRVLLSSG
jgi:hypothetical protein